MKNEISMLAKVVELLRRHLNKDLPSQHVALFLAVAINPGITMPELCKQLDMPQGTVSRNVKLMSHCCVKTSTKVTKNGYGLLRTGQAQTSRYQLSVYLTTEGELLIEKMVRLLEFKNTTENMTDINQINLHIGEQGCL